MLQTFFVIINCISVSYKGF